MYAKINLQTRHVFIKNGHFIVKIIKTWYNEKSQNQNGRIWFENCF